VFCSYLVDTRLHRIGICGYEYGCDISYPRQPWLRARYALVDDVRPSVSSSFVVRLVVIVILLRNTIKKLATLLLSQHWFSCRRLHGTGRPHHSRKSTIDLSPPVYKSYRFTVSVNTANDWFGLARRAGQLFIAVTISLIPLGAYRDSGKEGPSGKQTK